jgi:ferrous iron transport protein B
MKQEGISYTSVKADKELLVVAVAGNPNAGKSTLINAIAGTRLQVGNWPGVTVEKKEAVFDYQGRKIKLVDLPGTYSLSPYSQEELIARNYLLQEKPDVVLNVIDSTNLERNFYLTVQLLELGLPVVVALNIYDEAQAQGCRINRDLIEEMLGVKAITTTATKKKGLEDLLTAIVEVGSNPQSNFPRQLSYGPDPEAAADYVGRGIQENYPSLMEKYPPRWLAFKLMENDPYVSQEVNLGNDGAFIQEGIRHLRQAHEDEIEAIMADARYAQAAGLTREVLKRPKISRVELTEKIDRVLLNRIMGIPIFLAAMWLMFKLTFDVSSPFADWMDKVINGPVKKWAGIILHFGSSPDWLVSLVTDGIIGGAGFVFVFVPVIFAMMFFITLLEASGYMARAAFVMDRAMHAMGLHGKSFIPMLLGFGCNVPAIYATRTLENTRDKVLTALLVPLMSCGARLPVYALFAGAFFANSSGTVVWSLYVLGIGLAVLMGIIFKKTLFKGKHPLFIMELPPYRLPGMRNLLIHTWEKGKHFMVKAGTYLLAVSILTWFLLNLPWGVENKQDSYLGRAGAAVAPVLQPLGFGTWEAAAALITGVIAKEIIVGTMGEIYLAEAGKNNKSKDSTLGEDLREIGASFLVALQEAGNNVFSSFGVAKLSIEEKEKTKPLKTIIQGAFTPLSAYAFMAFVLLYMPCMVVAVAMRHEFGTWKWVGVALGYEMLLAWLVACAIYQGGKLLGLGG